MECPVCHSSAITDETRTCPDCNADLEALQLTKKIEKTSKNRLNFGIIMAILTVIVIVGWIVSCMIDWESDKEPKVSEVEEFSDLRAELENARNSNTKLRVEIKELSEKLSNAEKAKVKKEKTHIVKEGETLFNIAKKVYGNGYKYNDLAKDNNISDPDKIVAGQKLIIYY